MTEPLDHLEWALLPFIYAACIWNAHYEFMENLYYAIPRA